MPIDPKQIDVWRSLPTETAHLEFKEAKLQYDYRKLCKYCVAMANEGGGILLLGIADKLPRKVVGTQAFADVRSLAMKLFDDLGFRVEAGEIKHPDGRVVAFEIPSRPHGTATIWRESI